MTSRIPHVNDRTLKYSSMALKRRQHEYLGLPGDYGTRYPNEVVFPNMDSGRVDELYSTKEGILINLEEESGEVTEKTLEKIAKYRIFGNFVYSKRVYTVIICHRNPKNFPKKYYLTKTDILKPHYIYFPQEKLWAKYENIINKVGQKERLSEREMLDIAFIPKYISKQNAPFVTESLARIFKKVKNDDRLLKIDIGSILGAMIVKNISDEQKQIDLMEKIGMNGIKRDIKELVYDEFGDELKELENENLKLKQDIKKEKEDMKREKEDMKREKEDMKNKLHELKEISDWNTPKAKEIINSLMVSL